jgi:hypothetical protein
MRCVEKNIRKACLQSLEHMNGTEGKIKTQRSLTLAQVIIQFTV